MISDIAPVDLLLQRAGRLHRHTRNSVGDISQFKDTRTSPVLKIFTPKFSMEPEKDWFKDFSGSAAVYGGVSILWKTLKIIQNKTTWKIPDDSRALVEAVYGDESEFDVPESLFEDEINYIGKCQAKKAIGELHALYLEKGYTRNAVTCDQWSEETKVSTRLSEENIEIVLAIIINEKIMPYAITQANSWDWSSFSITKSAWEKSNYKVNPIHEEIIEQFKNENKRFLFSQIVIVELDSEKAREKVVCDSGVYDPKLGWFSDSLKYQEVK